MEEILMDISRGEAGELTSSPHRTSVVQALNQLQSKTRLLENEREYFANLYETSSAAFAQHREELGALVRKERDHAERRQEQLELELRNLMEGNAALQTRELEARSHARLRLQAQSDQFHHESMISQQRLRTELEQVHRDVLRIRSEVQSLTTEKESLASELSVAQQRNLTLRSNLRTTTRENTTLVSELANASKPRARAANVHKQSAPRGRQPVPLRQNKVRSGSASARTPFIPSGQRSRPDDITPSTTFNVGGRVQSLLKGALLSPERRRTDSDATLVPQGLDRLSRELEAEVRSLREEYAALVKDVTTDPRKLREMNEIVDQIDEKVHQHGMLRAAQGAANHDLRVKGILSAAAERRRRVLGMISELKALQRAHP